MDIVHIWIINLLRAHDKRTLCEIELGKLSNDLRQKVVFFNAVDGKTDLDGRIGEFHVVEEWREPFTRKQITLGEIGCALSHFDIWKKIADFGPHSGYHIILEDDIRLYDGVEHNLNKITDYLKKLNDGGELIDMVFLNRKPFQKDKEVVVVDLDGLKLVRPYYSYWMCAYMLSYEGAVKLVNSGFQRNIIPVDEFSNVMFGYGLFKQYGRYYHGAGEFRVLGNISGAPIIPLYKNAFAYSTTVMSEPYLSHVINSGENVGENVGDKLCIWGIGSEDTCGRRRFSEFCDIYGLEYRILGDGVKWKTDMAKGPGGGQKVSILQDVLRHDISNGIGLNDFIVVSDTYDVMCLSGPGDILRGYRKIVGDDHGRVVVFSAEKNCWPDKNLAEKYPVVEAGLPRFLNSGGFIGRKRDLWELVRHDTVGDFDDDQLYWSRKYLNLCLNKGDDDDDEGDVPVTMVLDNRCIIFQTLAGSFNDVVIKEKANIVKNVRTDTEPCILHGNGDINVKMRLNWLENYLGNNYSYIYDYIKANKLEEKGDIGTALIQAEPKKTVFVALFGDKTFYPDIKRKLTELNSGSICICWVGYYGTRGAETGHKSIVDFLDGNGDYYFMLEYDDAELTCSDLFFKLALRVENGCSVVAPFLRRGADAWSNFWGSVGENGWYSRSTDYYDILNGVRRGVWNVPYVTGCMMVSRKCALANRDMYLFKGVGDIDMTVCEYLRRRGWFIYVDNLVGWGHLLSGKRTRKVKEISEVVLGDYLNEDAGVRKMWEEKYFHPEYLAKRERVDVVEVCNDAYVFPLFSRAFCSEVIELVEQHGGWSRGGESHFDPRIGGKENYPTQDIHLRELGLEELWKKLISDCFAKLASTIYAPYKTKGMNIAFVVRYCPDGQKDLAPHHDASTYTLNISLNEHGVDYQGGGCKFVRQNKEHVGQPVGYCCIHPGRLTHYHQGLATTDGVRYILVSFIE